MPAALRLYRPSRDGDLWKVSQEAELEKQLRGIEARFAKARTSKEWQAAGAARQRLMQRMARADVDHPVEWQFSSLTVWERQLLMALARRYGLKPYRYQGQHRGTLILQAPKAFIKEVLGPEFKRCSETLRARLDEVAQLVLAEVLEEDPRREAQLSLPFEADLP